ncbi:MAG: hypothetical protein GY757_35350, partial [bacterium]|nr:hypothetical protein [bacterium]
RAYRPTDSLDDELPLLLNPYNEKRPLDHFHVFDENTGFLEGRTEEGKRMVEICALHREGLVNARKAEWEKVKIELLLKYVNVIDQKEPMELEDMPYSLYLKLALDNVANKMKADAGR